jgi:pimeloyl-ACP methyl ester carboxylesterase
VRLHVAVFPAETDDPAPDPVVYLEGGPGGHALETLEFSFDDRFAPFLAERDVIIFDQRGVGFSTPSLFCSELRELDIELLDDVLPPEELTAREIEALGVCRARLLEEGVDLDSYNSKTSALDVADLRVALGIDQWNLYGISYGTRLALTTARDHPAGVRSLILDSTVPPQVDLISETPAAVERSFDAFFAACGIDAACAATFPNLEQVVLSLRDRLNAAPANIEITDFLADDDTYSGVLTGDDLLGLMFEALYSETLIPFLPKAIADAADGNLARLEQLASLFFTTDRFFSTGMYLAVQCNEEYPFSSIPEVEAAVLAHPYSAPLYPDIAGEFAVCDLWGAGTADGIEDTLVASDIPALVLAGQFDPITPPRYGMFAAESLRQSYFFEFPGLAHGVSTADDCPLGITLDFLDNPAAAPDAACIGAMAGPSFLTPGRLSVELVPFSEDGPNGTVSGLVPSDWDSVGFGVYASPGLGDAVIVQRADPVSGIDVQAIADFWSDALEVGSWVEDSYSGKRQWSTFEGTDGEASFIIAVARDGDLFITVILQAPADLQSEYTDLVLLPALDAVEVG